MAQDTAAQQYAPWPIWQAMFAGALIIAVDALFLYINLFAFFTLIHLVLWGIPRALLSKKWSSSRWRQLTNLGIYTLAATMSLGANYANNQLAENRFKKVIAAIEGFHAKNGKYPDTLEELIPKFLPEVPKAKLGVGMRDFYLMTEEKTTLMYFNLPPFGQRTYSFDAKKFGYLYLD